MKKFLLPFFALAIGASGASAAVGEIFEVNGVQYEVTSAGEVEVYDVDTSLTAITLSETVSDGTTSYTLTSIGRDAFYYSKISEITIPNTVTALQYGAFRSCDNLATVNFGTGLKTIGDYCFYGDPITEMTIPEGVESVGGSCFFTAKKLTKITFPSSLKSLGSSCFYNSPVLQEVVLPDGLENLGAKAFMRCTALTTVNIPSGITAIGEGTFYECTALTSVTLPENLTTIGKEAFWGSGLTSIQIPANVQEIGGAAFSGTKIDKFDVASGSEYFTTVDDILYTADKSLLVAVPPVFAPTSVTVDPACRGISYGAFDKSNVTTVTLNEGLRAIDECAFVQSKLSSITFPESVVFIGEQAFAGTQLTDVTLPKNLPMVQDGSFAQISTLKSVTIPAAVKYIAIRAFTFCGNLTTINCEGMTPPELEDWYESYENPFANVPSNGVVNVPSNAVDAYLASAWKNAFSASQIKGDLAAGIAAPEADPAYGAQVASFDGVTLTFAENVSVAKSSPAVKVIKGRLVGGVPVGDAVSVDDWMAVSQGATSVKVFPADWDGYTSPFNMEKGSYYFVTIPAGTFKTASGALSEEIMLAYEGSYVAPVVKFIDAEPAVDSSLDEISVLTLNFEESVTVQSSKLGDIKVYEGPIADGYVMDSWWMTVYGESTGTSVSIFSTDDYGDGYSEPLSLMEGVDYYVVLPAGLFRLTSSYSTQSPEIVLHYKGPEPKAFELLDFYPEDGATLSSFEGMMLTFSDMAVYQESVAQNIKAVKATSADAIADGEVVTSVDFWACPENYSTELMLFPSDWDGFTAPISINASADLFLIIPAGTFTNLRGNAKTPEMIVRYTNGYSGVSSVGINDSSLVIEPLAGAVRVVADKFAVYSVSGQQVAAGEGDSTVALLPGVYTVRATGSGSALRIAKVIVK
ncbi:MAG: leucine-rich repeat domain-containing protein [Muribaculaceae bacterium]|nr:leucine-rich repeat domain-containing protein [Muribaculaceae bacterium]